MKLKFWEKEKVVKPQSVVKEWFNSIVFAVIAATLIRWTTVEAFVVPTPSMENTILVGDYLFVSKLHYGTRTTTTPLQIPLTHQKIWGTNIPSYLDWIELPSYRLPGFSSVKRGDVVVFNVPPISLSEGVEYPVQLKSNYVKRCVGVAGDLLEVRNKQVVVNGLALPATAFMKFRYIVTSKDEITARTLKNLELSSDDFVFSGKTDAQESVYRMWLTEAQVKIVNMIPVILSVEEDPTTHNGPESNIFPSSSYSQWNGDDYGPLKIPAKGMKIDINDSTVAFYGETIQLYEGLDDVQVGKGTLNIDGKAVTEYIFRQDYYFMMGDNRHNSLDSRYWGFVPKDHIVGKPIFIWFSMDYEADFLHKIRWNRLFNSIE